MLFSHLFFILLLSILIGFLYWQHRKSSQEEVVFTEIPFSERKIKPGNKFQKHLDKSHIKNIIFVHGTFVGDDPLGVFDAFGLKTGKGILKTVTSGVIKKTLGEQGHFTDEYIQLIREAFPEIEIHNFLWSSGNYHLARLKGALDLLTLLEKLTINSENSDRILLIGHSHAGQIFSILSQLVNEKTHQFIQKIYPEAGDLSRFMGLARKKFVFTTLGAPALYKWNPKNRWKILHIINHRGNQSARSHQQGWQKTVYGDYIQAIGGPATETPITQIELNRKLGDHFRLDDSDTLYYPNSKTILADFKDQSRDINFYKTLFGHGVYTKSTSSYYIFRIICTYLLGIKDVDS